MDVGGPLYLDDDPLSSPSHEYLMPADPMVPKSPIGVKTTPSLCPRSRGPFPHRFALIPCNIPRMIFRASWPVYYL
jgi:hypothetical protein